MGRRPKYEGCKYEKCTKKHYCKGFCKKHFNAYYHKRIDSSGAHLNGYVPKNPASYCKFPDCWKRGTAKQSLRRGLCNKHRKWAMKGIIDWDTCQILKPERIPVKKPLDVLYIDGKQYVFRNKCRIKTCLKESRRNNLCQGHSSSYKAGKIDYDGNPLYERRYYDLSKDKCKVKDCNFKTKRMVKGFCLYHYNQPYRKGLIDINGKPTGKVIPDRRFKKEGEKDGHQLKS